MHTPTVAIGLRLRTDTRPMHGEDSQDQERRCRSSQCSNYERETGGGAADPSPTAPLTVLSWTDFPGAACGKVHGPSAVDKACFAVSVNLASPSPHGRKKCAERVSLQTTNNPPKAHSPDLHCLT